MCGTEQSHCMCSKAFQPSGMSCRLLLSSLWDSFILQLPPSSPPHVAPRHAQKCHQLSHFTLEVSPFHSFWKHRSHSRGPYNNYYFNILKPTKIFEIKKNNWPRDQAWFFSTFACFCGMLRSPVPPLQTHGGSIEAVIHYHPCKGDTFHEFHEPHWGVFW